MNVGKWGRQLLAGAACLAMVGTVCLPVAGCGRRKEIKGEADMPAKAKAKAEQMRKEGMKAGVKGMGNEGMKAGGPTGMGNEGTKGAGPTGGAEEQGAKGPGA